MLYLRARYYDPNTGRFNRLDPFFGVLSDPQSLHKYTYCHADPVNGIDPAGLFFFGIAFSGFTVLARFGYEAGKAAIATTALSAAFGAGVGAIGYYTAGENPWVGAYNGALIGASLRIAYLTGGVKQIGKIAYAGFKSALIRMLSEVIWAAYSYALPDLRNQDISHHARNILLCTTDSLAIAMWNSATSGFADDFFRDDKHGIFRNYKSVDELATISLLIINTFDTVVNSVISDRQKMPPLTNAEIAKNASTAVAIEVTKYIIENIAKKGIKIEELGEFNTIVSEALDVGACVVVDLGIKLGIEFLRTLSTVFKN